MADSAKLRAQSMDSPDETRTFEKGKMEIVNVEEVTAGRVTFEPGWRWSEIIKPIVGTDSCQVQHTAYVIRPGHDAWIVGDETYVGVDFSRSVFQHAGEF